MCSRCIRIYLPNPIHHHPCQSTFTHTRTHTHTVFQPHQPNNVASDGRFGLASVAAERTSGRCILGLFGLLLEFAGLCLKLCGDRCWWAPDVSKPPTSQVAPCNLEQASRIKQYLCGDLAKPRKNALDLEGWEKSTPSKRVQPFINELWLVWLFCPASPHPFSLWNL